MKTPFATLRTYFAKTLAAALLIANLSAAAQSPAPGTPVDAAITYAGTVNNKILFSVNYENKSAASFTLDIMDGEGYRFYGDRFSQTSFRKFFAIDKDELKEGSITIQLATKEGLYKQTFDINTRAKFVEEVSVVKR